VTAALLPEPTNRYDRNAVAVFVAGHQVGHLSREDAIIFKPVLAELARRGKVAMCAATIVGGWDRGRNDRGSFGVKLDLVRPGEGPTDEEVFRDAVDRLRDASGPAARRNALKRALESLQSDEVRAQLMLEASKVEVDAVLEKVAGLKTPAVKRRRLQEALDAIRADAVDDQLQAQQIAWLEEAIRSVDGPAKG
jgi:hypothetical protein